MNELKSNRFMERSTSIGLKLLEGQSIEISDHPLKSFNGIYEPQSGKLNNKFWYKNKNDRYLYHYNQAEGGPEKLESRSPEAQRH